MEDEVDPFAGAGDSFMEADQGPEESIVTARDNLEGLLRAVEEHRSAMEQLRVDHAAGTLDLPTLKQELETRERLVKSLKNRTAIFERRVRQLGERISSKN